MIAGHMHWASEFIHGKDCLFYEYVSHIIAFSFGYFLMIPHVIIDPGLLEAGGDFKLSKRKGIERLESKLALTQT